MKGFAFENHIFICIWSFCLIIIPIFSSGDKSTNNLSLKSNYSSANFTSNVIIKVSRDDFLQLDLQELFPYDSQVGIWAREPASFALNITHLSPQHIGYIVARLRGYGKSFAEFNSSSQSFKGISIIKKCNKLSHRSEQLQCLSQNVCEIDFYKSPEMFEENFRNGNSSDLIYF